MMGGEARFEDLERNAQGGRQGYDSETVKHCVKNLKGSVGYFEGFLAEKSEEGEESAEELDN